MPLVANADCHAADAYIQKAVPLSSAYKVIVEFKVTTATLTALYAASRETAEVVWTEFSFFNRERIVGDYNSTASPTGISDYGWLPDSYETNHPGAFSLDPPIPVDVYFPIELDLSYVSGTTWLHVWKINGTTISSESKDRGVDDTSILTVKIPGAGAQHITGEAYRAASCVVKNAGGATIFSDYFLSGDFSAWDSVHGAMTIVDDPAAPPPPTPPASATIGIRAAFGSLTYDATPFFYRLDDPTVPPLS